MRFRTTRQRSIIQRAELSFAKCVGNNSITACTYPKQNLFSISRLFSSCISCQKPTQRQQRNTLNAGSTTALQKKQHTSSTVAETDQVFSVRYQKESERVTLRPGREQVKRPKDYIVYWTCRKTMRTIIVVWSQRSPKIRSVSLKGAHSTRNWYFA